MQHLDEGEIHAWLDGALSESEAARIATHADECAACAAMVAEARGFVAGTSRIVASLDVVRGDVVPPSLRAPNRRTVWQRLHTTPVRSAVAATLVLAAGTLLSVWHGSEVPQPIVVMQPSARPAADSAPPVFVRTAVPQPKPKTEALKARPENRPATSVDAVMPPVASTIVRESPKANVASAAAAPLPSAGAAAAEASAPARRAMRLDDVASSRAPAPALARMSQFSPGASSGCYEMVDAGDELAAITGARFLLDTVAVADSTPSRHAVRRLGGDGRPGASVDGAWWQSGAGGPVVTVSRPTGPLVRFVSAVA